MARHFAYKNREAMPVLWIPSSDESQLIRTFESYAKQICSESNSDCEPVSLVRDKLSELYRGEWLVVFDGLDNPALQRHIHVLIGDVSEGKVLITTRNKGLANEVEDAQILHVCPLDEDAGEQLLCKYVSPSSSSAAGESSTKEAVSPTERDARRRIVREVGGLPLAISVIGASLRTGNGPRMTCKDYLTWPVEAKEIFLQRDQHILGYSSSVWKAFDFAFGKFLSRTEGLDHVASMAFFIASCTNASNLAHYYFLHRQFRGKDSGPRGLLPPQGSAASKKLLFLQKGYSDDAVCQLEGINMITVNWTRRGQDPFPHIEMHSLVRNWLERRYPEEIFSYAALKLWILGSGIHDHISRGLVAFQSEFQSLTSELKSTLNKCGGAVPCYGIPVSNIIFPFLLEAQKELSQSVSHLPPPPLQLRRHRQFGDELETEISRELDRRLDHGFDWEGIFDELAGEFQSEVETTIRFLPNKAHDFTLKKFFLEILDGYACVDIAFDRVLRQRWQFSAIGLTDLLQAIESDLTNETASLLRECVPNGAITQLMEMTRENPPDAVRQWVRRWQDAVCEAIRRSLGKVVAKHCFATNISDAMAHDSSQMGMGGSGGGTGDILGAITNADDPLNAFFATIRQVLTSAVSEYLDDHPAAMDCLETYCNGLRDVCELAIRKALGDQMDAVFRGQPPSSEAENSTGFAMLWELAWPSRFPGKLTKFIAVRLMNSISDSLHKAARSGFSLRFGYLIDENLLQDLAQESISNIFLNWNAAGWISLPSDDDDDGSTSEEGQTHAERLNEARQGTLEAMKMTYNDKATVSQGGSLAIKSLELTLTCRGKLHEDVMSKLDEPDLTDQKGLGPFFAKLYLEHCDENLRLVYSMLGDTISSDGLAAIDRMARKETEWNLKRKRAIEDVVSDLSAATKIDKT